MADNYDTQVPYANGVTVATYSWGRIFTGEREAIIAAGLAEAAWFPGEPGQGKTVGRGRRGEREIRVRRNRNTKRRFAVWVDYNESEQRLRKVLEKETKELAELPTSHDDFRARHQRMISVLLGMVRFFTLETFGDYRYTLDTKEAVSRSVTDLMATIRNGQTEFSAPARARSIAKIKASTAGADPALQEFLAKVITTVVTHPPRQKKD